MRYTVKRTRTSSLDAMDFDAAEIGRIDQARPESSDHRPETRFRALHDGAMLYLRFDVRDRYVRSLQTRCQGPVCGDSCVECFVQPRPDRGYFNMEVNAGGALLLHYVEDPTRTSTGGLARTTPLPEIWTRQTLIRSSLPPVVAPEISEPLDWNVRMAVPMALFEAFAGPIAVSGAVWRANFYKCGDATSHPHWIAWAPVPERNFHLPASFGELALE